MGRIIRVLVIDSCPNCVGLPEALQTLSLSAQLDFCTSADATARFEQSPPDLVLLEIVLPDSDGIELLHFIKHHHPETRVIAMSAGSPCLPRDIVLYWAGRLGADVVLPKPFGVTELQRALYNALSGREPALLAEGCHP